ncbi:MAG TPA: co-chaperone GroES [Bacteroidales bacterium]|nr:co-chaperone GroES [Bacteroidales bacterium]
MKEIQPVNQNVLIEFSGSEMERKTISGIIIPTIVENTQNMGKILALSNIENSELAVGDTVLFNQANGREIDLESQKYIMLQYSDILAKIVETEAI